MNSVEWFKAQGLLLKLVQVLTPLTEDELPPFYIIDPRFFTPPVLEKSSFKHPVRLLTTLQSVQKQVEEFVGDAPAKDVPDLKAPLARQAQRLIRQVQDAIGKLCHSANIKEPKEEPLREALTHLKPNLERLIEEVQRESVERGGVEEISLPAAPFTPYIKTLISDRKKKKRKGFGFRDEDEPKP